MHGIHKILDHPEIFEILGLLLKTHPQQREIRCTHQTILHMQCLFKNASGLWRLRAKEDQATATRQR